MTKYVQQKIIAAGQLPEPLRDLLNELSSNDKTAEIGLQVAISITRHRKRAGVGPSFAEVLDPMISELANEAALACYSAAERAVIYSMRHHVAVQLRRSGWIGWNRGARSLRTGPTFSTAARAHAKSRNRL